MRGYKYNESTKCHEIHECITVAGVWLAYIPYNGCSLQFEIFPVQTLRYKIIFCISNFCVYIRRQKIKLNLVSVIHWTTPFLNDCLSIWIILKLLS